MCKQILNDSSKPRKNNWLKCVDIFFKSSYYNLYLIRNKYINLFI